MVLVVLEQIRPDYLDTVWSQVGTGGLRRLIEHGAYFPDCRHSASSFPASTLATLGTGAWPAQHGIVADRWYDRRERGPVRASAESLLATTLPAQVAAAPNCRVFTVSMDETKGSLLTGTPLAQHFWMQDDGAFISRGQSPSWLGEYNRLHPLESLHGAEWYAVGARNAPSLRTLSYERPQDFLNLYRASPFALNDQFNLLLELINREKLGQGNTFDMVCVVVTASALLGYETGARSPLMQQMTLQLDHQLERLFDQLDRQPGGNRYNLILAGAHGAPPEPFPVSRPRMAVNGESLAQAIQHRLTLSKAARVEKYLYPFLYLDAAGARASDGAESAAGRAALEDPDVAAYFTNGGECSVHDEFERLFRNSFHPLRSGDVMLSYQPEYIEDTGIGRGISYGSLYTYDTKVPLCFYGPQFRAGVFEAPVQSVDVAPTLARAVGVEPPSSSSGRVLGEAFLGSDESAR